MQILVTYDTKTKQLTATADGAPIEDLDEIRFAKCWSPTGTPNPAFYSLEMVSRMLDDGEGTFKSTRVSASLTELDQSNFAIKQDLLSVQAKAALGRSGK